MKICISNVEVMSFGKLGNKLEVEIFLGAIRSHLFFKKKLETLLFNFYSYQMSAKGTCEGKSGKKSNFNSRAT